MHLKTVLKFLQISFKNICIAVSFLIKLQAEDLQQYLIVIPAHAFS